VNFFGPLVLIELEKLGLLSFFGHRATYVHI